ncbi:hypothetical protein CR513_44318, partial [Mucuna pruriens]
MKTPWFTKPSSSSGYLRYFPRFQPMCLTSSLVGKKDGLWRLCIDYKGLINQTVKDKFLILLLDNLLYELGRSNTKLDLRAGYHQLRMHKDDVYKTTFRGGASLGEHVQHLQVVLDVLRIHIFQELTNSQHLEAVARILKTCMLLSTVCARLFMGKFPNRCQRRAAFDMLKKVHCSAPVLALPDFNRTFIRETEASGFGFEQFLCKILILLPILVMGYNFEIPFKKGQENKVADALLVSSCGKMVIFVAIDRLSKETHFKALAHPFITLKVTQYNVDNIE